MYTKEPQIASTSNIGNYREIGGLKKNIYSRRAGLKNIMGKFPSLKMGRIVIWKSQLERDFIYLLEFDPDVSFFKEQSVAIKYKYKNKPRQYTPDFYVERNSTKELIEVEPTSKVNDLKNVIRFLAAAAYCKNKGYIFKVVTDDQIREGSLLSNIKLLHRYATLNVHKEFCQQAMDLIQISGEISLEKLITIFKENSRLDSISNIYHLLYHKVLTADLKEPLCGRTIIKACQI